MFANLISMGRMLRTCLFSSLFLLPFALNAQTAADIEASNRLATFNGATGILRVPSLPYDGAHIWAELLYESDEDVTLVGTGPANGLGYGGQGIVLLSDNPPQVVVDDDVHGTMSRAASVFAAVACNASRGAKDELKAVLLELCDSRLLSTLQYFQAEGLFEGMETVLQGAVSSMQR